MPCTTILAGKDATYDGSTMMARNDDSGAGKFTVKKYVLITPDQQPEHYESVTSHVKIDLPTDPMSYTCCPNVEPGTGYKSEAGINAATVAMSATETITSNPRVLGADPLVETGIGEEDFVTIILPYIHSAREGVLYTAKLLEQYGTYEMSGIGFSDPDEVWYLETIGGHHWMARRVPDNSYAVIPNQLGIDYFDFEDAAGPQKNCLCSADLKAFVQKNHLDLSMDPQDVFDPRAAFGSHADSDHSYNTPRAWWMERYFNPNTFVWDGPDADYKPDSDDIPWCLVPEKKITVEDIRYVLAGHYQGTPYDPYMHHGDMSMAGAFRTIGINRTAFLGLCQMKADGTSVEWLSFAANEFNALIPFYQHISATPAYVADTTMEVNTDSFYWTSRLIAAMADAVDRQTASIIERYQNRTMNESHRILDVYDPQIADAKDEETRQKLCMEANQKLADMAEAASQETLGQVLYTLSNNMKNAFSRSDA